MSGKTGMEREAGEGERRRARERVTVLDADWMWKARGFMSSINVADGKVEAPGCKVAFLRMLRRDVMPLM